MSTTNILDLNNRIDKLTKSYPSNKVMMSDGVTSVEDALDEVTNRFIYVTQNISDLAITNQWGGLYMNNVNVNISNLGLTNAPTVFGVSYNPSPITNYAALPIVSHIGSTAITVTLARGTIATTDGTLILTLKSND